MLVGKRHAGRPAFVFGDSAFTFGEIDRRSTRLAHGLRGIGVGKGDHVAIAIGNRPEYAEAEFAVAKLGAVRVPLLTQSTASEFANCLQAADCKAAIMSLEAADGLRIAGAGLGRTVALVATESTAPGEFLYDALVEAGCEGALDVPIQSTDPYAIRFTGGTTGVPKGVMMSHRNMVAVVVNTVLNWPLDRSDVGLHIHPLSHAAGMMMYAYWLLGATSVISPAFRFGPADFIAAVERHRVTSVFMVPTSLGSLLDFPGTREADLSSLRTIVYGGAPIPFARLEQGLARLGPVFLQVYGTSEAPFALTTLYPDEHSFAPGELPARLRSAGRPIFNVQVRVVDEAGNPLPTGQTGEIAAKTDTAMVGYFRNPELTAKRIVDGWVRTGDMGFFDAEGYLYIVDRKDDVVITGGFNVWPTDVEDVLARHPAVGEAAVFGVHDAKWGEVVTAAVALKAGKSVTEMELVAFLAERIAKYKVPKRIWITDNALPKSAVGKILRRRVREEWMRVGN